MSAHRVTRSTLRKPHANGWTPYEEPDRAGRYNDLGITRNANLMYIAIAVTTICTWATCMIGLCVVAYTSSNDYATGNVGGISNVSSTDIPQRKGLHLGLGVGLLVCTEAIQTSFN